MIDPLDESNRLRAFPVRERRRVDERLFAREGDLFCCREGHPVAVAASDLVIGERPTRDSWRFRSGYSFEDRPLTCLACGAPLSAMDGPNRVAYIGQINDGRSGG